jgi:hypothetical protein
MAGLSALFLNQVSRAVHFPKTHKGDFDLRGFFGVIL